MKPIENTPGTNFSGDTESHGSRPKKRTNALILTIIVIALFAALFIWKQLEISNIRKEAERERVSIQEQARQKLLLTNEQYLQLFSKPFVWAIRTEMLQGNLSQVHLYLNQMVKEKNFKNIVVANDKGIIVSSTNKKLEGQLFNTIGNESYLSSNSIIIENQNNVLTCSSPIMGFNNKLGTLLITYQLPPVEFK